MWCTDGSSREVDGRQIIGGGEYCLQSMRGGVADRVHCACVRTTNTINIADLCAAMHCIECADFEKDEVLATDNNVFMCLLNRHIRSLVQNVEGQHNVLLHAMAERVQKKKQAGVGCTRESS